MSSPMAEQPPATPDQALGNNSSGEGMASPVLPPPPPENAPSGTVMGVGGVPVALGSAGSAAVPVEVTGSSVADKPSLADRLSGIAISDEAAGEGNGDKSTEGEEDEEDETSTVAEAEDDNEEDEEGEENEVELPREVMKRLYQLKALQSEKDVVYDKYKTERADLERKFAGEYGAIYSRRAEVVAGRAKDMDDAEGTEPVAEDEASETGVPHFWMQCMLHHEALHDVVCEHDLEALYYLSDVRCVDKDNLLGFTLEFHFDDNPYFSNAVLTKRYDTANIMDQGEPLLEGVEGTPIEWKSRRNLCEKVSRRKVKRAGSRGGETRTVTKVEKTESFFKFFQNPVMYDDEDEDEDEYNFSFDMDYEVARIFRNHLIPNAVLWFTGEAVSEDDDEDDMEEDDEEMEDDDEETNGAGGVPPKTLNFEAPGGFEAPPSGSVEGEECRPWVSGSTAGLGVS